MPNRAATLIAMLSAIDHPYGPALATWVADVERRLPQPQSPPRPRVRDANTEAIERAVAARDTAAAEQPPETAAPAAELCGKCNSPLQGNGDWRTCHTCSKAWQVPTRVRPEARAQSAWVVAEEPAAPAEPPADVAVAPGPVEALRELLAEVAHEPGRPHEIVWRAHRLARALRTCRAHQVMVFRPGQVLP